MKICPICKEEFEPAENVPYQTYCSVKCRRKARRTMSRKEREANRRPVLPFYCEWCGAFVQTKPGDHRFRYCSRKCRTQRHDHRKEFAGAQLRSLPGKVFFMRHLKNGGK